MDDTRDTDRKIKLLNEGLEALRSIKPENWQRLWRKFRLEWNYNSNHIEGNTLTYGETELLLIFDKTKGDHSKREYDEMQAHDVAIKMVQELAADHERPLTESFIRKLNEIILVRPYWKEAVTPDGQNTRREIKIGVYKSFPNSVRLANGEMFHYAKPEETPALMHDLMNWYNDNAKLNPVELAAQVHYRFVRIHPFDDGNGRVARLLVNYVLLKAGYPPVIIKSKDKANYLTALNKADTGDTPSFIKYIADQLAWSCEITVKAAKGESVDEDGDFDKRLNQLDKKLTSKLEISNRNEQLMLQALDEVFFPALIAIDKRINKLSYMFENYRHAKPSPSMLNTPGANLHYGELLTLLASFRNDIKRGLHHLDTIYFLLHGFKKSLRKFDIWIDISVEFNTSVYDIIGNVSETTPSSRHNDLLKTNLLIGSWGYSEIVSKELLESKADEIANRVMDIIENKIKDNV